MKTSEANNLISPSAMEKSHIGDAWSSLRGLLQQEYPTKDIKGILGKANLPIFKITYDGTHKGPLLDEADKLVRNMDTDSRDRFVIGYIEEIISFEQVRTANMTKLQIQPDKQILDDLENVLARAGFGLSGGAVFPLSLQLDIETASLPVEVSAAITEALRRYRDGRFAGAITSICGAVDQITEKIFLEKSLGNHKEVSYQERVSKSFAVFEVEYCTPLQKSRITADEVKLIWANHKKSVSQAAYVLGAFRREYSDSHGQQNAPREFVQKTLDCAVFILRSFCGILNRNQ